MAPSGAAWAALAQTSCRGSAPGTTSSAISCCTCWPNLMTCPRPRARAGGSRYTGYALRASRPGSSRAAVKRETGGIPVASARGPHVNWGAWGPYRGPLKLVQNADGPRILVPRGGDRPHHDDQQREHDGGAPAEHRGQEPPPPQLAERARLHGGQPRERGAQRESDQRGPELDLPLTRTPDGAGSAATRQRHPDAEDRAARECANPRTRKHPVALVLEIDEFQDGEAQRAHGQGQRGRARVLGVAGHERLAESAHPAEGRALGDHAQEDAEQQAQRPPVQ